MEHHNNIIWDNFQEAFIALHNLAEITTFDVMLNLDLLKFRDLTHPKQIWRTLQFRLPTGAGVKEVTRKAIELEVINENDYYEFEAYLNEEW